MKRIVIIGATSSMAEHCARLWLSRAPADLTLIGRDTSKLERIAADLRVRSAAAQIRIGVADLLSTAGVQAMVDDVMRQGPVDTVLVAHGSLADQALCQEDLAATREALEINGISPVLCAEAFAHAMSRSGSGTIALIGSVAGDRGRKSNYVYGAAKGLMDRYAQGMQHRFSGTGVKVVLIKPGPTDTPMTASLKSQGARLAPVEEVAAQIVDAIARGRPVAYVPGKWRLIMMIIRHLPAVIFNKLNI
ncbi:SDR family NAD(P)-dependent oxidoreductase [Herbaspirillum frisingense]|uniref:SDR family NAD(P)-dependent oxidoreductase n=1 Tax=Herbaspirillum frisingense TaxID=92645 RepID=UPI0039AFF116